MSRRLAWSRRQNLTTCRGDIPDISKTCLHVANDMSFGGVPRHDMTPTFPTKFQCRHPIQQWHILNIAHIKHIISLATEAESGALYIMARNAVYICIILEAMGHAHPPTPIQTNDAMADSVVNGKVQPKRTKAMDICFHWLCDHECQQQFRIYWHPGKYNYADYWTKHHLAKHHQQVRREFINPMIVPEMLCQDLQQNNRLAAAAA